MSTRCLEQPYTLQERTFVAEFASCRPKTAGNHDVVQTLWRAYGNSQVMRMEFWQLIFDMSELMRDLAIWTPVPSTSGCPTMVQNGKRP